MCKSPKIPIMNSSEVAFRLERRDACGVIGINASAGVAVLRSRIKEQNRTIVKFSRLVRSVCDCFYLLLFGVSSMIIRGRKVRDVMHSERVQDSRCVRVP